MKLSVSWFNLKNWVVISVNLFVILVEVLLIARVFFKFVFTAASGSFFQWIYGTTDAAVQPFRGIYAGTQATPTTHWYIDWVALFAIAAYPIVFYSATSVAGWLARRK